MKKLFLLILVSTLFLSSCDKEMTDEEFDKSIQEINEEISNSDIRFENDEEDDFLEQMDSNQEEIKEEIKQEAEKEKIDLKMLNAKFYSQFPLDISTWKKYEEPYANFCEESSILNAYYALKNLEPSTEEYIDDLDKLKEIEDKLYGEDWYKHTSTIQSLITLLFFQNDEKYLNEFLEVQSKEKKDSIIWELINLTALNNWVWWKIIFSPEISDIEEAIINDNLVVVPLYWKWLENNLFTDWWPVYHNLVIKWFIEDSFITNEVWVSLWDSYEYSKEMIMNNIHDYFPQLYPEKFDKGEARILVLFKYTEDSLARVTYSEELYKNELNKDFKNSWSENFEDFKDSRSMIDYYVWSKIWDVFKNDFEELEKFKKDSLDFINQEKIIKSKIDWTYNQIWVPSVIRNYWKEDYMIDRNMNLNFLLDFKY